MAYLSSSFFIPNLSETLGKIPTTAKMLSKST